MFCRDGETPRTLSFSHGRRGAQAKGTHCRHPSGFQKDLHPPRCLSIVGRKSYIWIPRFVVLEVVDERELVAVPRRKRVCSSLAQGPFCGGLADAGA